LDTILSILLHPDTAGLPVTAENGTAIGWITHRDVLRTYHHHLSTEHPSTPPGIDDHASTRHQPRPADNPSSRPAGPTYLD
ncbi:MAG: CBS domain-containing protein, partial [Mycobacteriales bacterium]